MTAAEDTKSAPRRHPLLRWIAFTGLFVVVLLAAIAAYVIRHVGPIVKARVLQTLSARFDSKVELDTFDVSVAHGLDVSGGGLRIFAPADMVAAGATGPIIAAQHFSFHADWHGVLLGPKRVGTVYVSGLAIHVPPREARQASRSSGRRRAVGVNINLHILCEKSDLILDNRNPDRDPKHFVLNRIELWDVGMGSEAGHPSRYDITMVNALPRGDIHAVGQFGPWINESPSDSSISGHYTFDNADLNTIKGIGGTLSALGDFSGKLNHIDITGTTLTPDFSLDTANQPMPLTAEFKAVVDGTTGDTYLTDVNARLERTPIACKGSVVNIKGQGHVIDLDVNIPSGNVQDLLGLAVKTRPVYLLGQISSRAKLHIRPGKESVSQKLSVQGGFTLHQIHFTNSQLQDKVDGLSLRAQGRPGEAKPGAPQVPSQMTGNFNLNGGRINFEKLDYTLPGAEVQLDGIYSLNGEQFDFHGKVRTEAQVSEMVSTWWKQLLLKPVDRFFRKDGAGTEVPIKISGVHNVPKLGLDFGHDKETKKP